MSTLVTLTTDAINNRVMTTNSFTKEEMEAHRAMITDARKARREELSKFTGANVGTVIDGLKESRNAVLTSMVTRTSAQKQRWIITLTAKRNASPADLLKEKAARAAKQLAKYQKELNTLQNAKPVAPAAPAKTVEPAKA